MANIIYKNELIKRKFLDYLIHSRGFSRATVKCFEQAIWLWEDFTSKADFNGFNKTKGEEFKNWLTGKKRARSEYIVSVSYRYDILRYLKIFLDWLSKQKGYRRINPTDIDYLNLSKSEVRIATANRKRTLPLLDEVKTVIEHIKGETETEMRDKALLSLTLLTGGRLSAIMSLPIRSLDRVKLVIYQDPKWGVKTKFSKAFITAILPFPYGKALDYFLHWFDYLENQRKFGLNDPIFPATKLENAADTLGFFSTDKVEPIFWKSSTSARKIFEKRFKQAGVKYYHPHTFRHLLIKEISKLPLTEEQKKAISQNLGHEDVGTTFGSYGYGYINEEKQVEIIRDIDFEGQKREVKYLLGDDDIERIALRLKPAE